MKTDIFKTFWKLDYFEILWKFWNFMKFLKILNFKIFIFFILEFWNFMIFFNIFLKNLKFYEIFENYIVNLPEMSNRQNSGVIFRFSKVRLGSVLLWQRVLLRSDWGMSNAYYPMKLIDFCMKYDKAINSLIHKASLAKIRPFF